jgi:RHS repeat-associated protein
VKGAENKDRMADPLSTEGGKTKSNAIELPSLSLPKGGGAIKGIDEKFSVNAVNGTASFAIPLPFANARGASPNLSLSYNSGSGNGIFGLGWSLSLASIKRKTENELPQYQDAVDSDTFLFSEAEDLVPEFEKENDGSLKVVAGDYVIHETDSPDGNFTIRFYKPRIEGQFARIERWSAKSSGEIKWRVISKENVTTLFGWTATARITDPNVPARIFAWLPEFVFDDKGNCARYLYKQEDAAGFDPAPLHNRNRFANGQITYANTYLSKVLYGNKTPYRVLGDPFPVPADFMFETVFDFGEYNPAAPYDQVNVWSFRPDAFSSYKSGFEIRTTRLCRRVLLFHHFAELPGGSALVKSIDFAYDAGPTFTFLESLNSRGYIKHEDGSYTDKALPTLEFAYQQPDWNKEVKSISAESLVHSPAGLADSSYQFTDLFNEGLSGILTEKADGWYYKHNLGGGQFERARLVSPKPSFAGFGSPGGLQLADLDADGGKQIVNYDREPKGFFELSDENEWLPFRSFPALPNIDFRDPNTRLLDLSGDGTADVLITEDTVFTWYQSAGRNGFRRARQIPRQTDEEAGPHLVFAEATQTVFLADMTGDGLTDIVRIRNGEVCYWPNLGYGNFGAKVSMDDPPVFDHPESFNPVLIRLADIDGSGVADIIYLGQDKFSCWMNRSGNGYDPFPLEIDSFPDVTNPSQIDVIDLLGNGVACIVHSSALAKDASAALRYVDLMNGKKPHLMTGYQNNMGKEVSLEYAPSTRFYIEDKLAGKPWVTKLHFPVHCIVKTETRDHVSGYRFVTSYKYHHGYYDHPEKEFRGFGRVEQNDSENFEHWEGAAGNVVDRELHQAPVLTKSWFHTGAFLGRERILDQFVDEYWYEEMRRHGYAVVNNEVPLPDARLITAPGLDAALIDELSGEEWREALRACKGMAQRVEIFGKDAPVVGATPEQLKRELTPYSAATHNCTIELIQPRGRNKHAVYVVKESQSVSYGYERETDDPRVTHTLNIKFDEYANVLESATVVYPRVTPDLSLPAETGAAQGRTIISYVRTTLTGDIDTADDYRLRMAAEVETYELKGVTKSGTLYDVNDFDGILAAAANAEYHEIDVEPAPGTSQKRLIEHVRTLFYKGDLSGPLPLHQLSSNGFRFEDYQLAYTPALLTDIFGPRVDAALMLEGKFTNSEGDANWWIRSGSLQFLQGGESLSDAEARFYLPISYTDPFGATTKVKYFSNYFLLIEETEDALQNKATVLSFNFHTLSPRRLRDANDNISEAIADELGLIKAVALFGKGAEADDLTGINEFTSPAESGLINNFLFAADSVQLTAFARNLLQHATTYFVYDLDAYRNSGGQKPSVAASIVREQHFADNPDGALQLSFEYSNGLGQVLMKKVQAEPGLAKKVTVNPDDTYSVSSIDTSISNPQLLRWIGNGRTVLNNKGNPVKQYEPYFSVTHQFENLKELVETGVTKILYYDPAGRTIKTEFPDATFNRMVFDSWQQSIYDQNDTVLDSDWYKNRFFHLIDAELTAAGKDPAQEKLAAESAAKHYDTPAIRHFDTLGRPVGLREHNKDNLGADLFYHTRMDLDLEGNLRRITDARNNAVMQYKYDMLGHKVYEEGADAGKRWLLQNITGNPLRTWDERNHEFSFEYDILHRPVAKKVQGGDGATPLDNVYEKTTYGENLLNDKLNNLRAKPVIVYDSAGKSETSLFDFKGNPRQASRRFAENYRDAVDWAGGAPDAKLSAETFASEFTYDAINRVIRQTAPDGSIFETTFNEAGLLETVEVTENGNAEFFVTNVDYNEKGQRTRILYGNNVSTDYFYDQETFRLIRLQTKRANNDPLQDLHYTFDPIGNVTHIEDTDIPAVFFDNQKITGVAAYTYDALYRLIEATGREHVAQPIFGQFDNWNDQPFLRQYSEGEAMVWRNYTQQYDYDAVGNLDEMRHVAAGGNWTRTYAYAANNNHLQSTSVGGDTYNYTTHPQHGFLTALPHLQVVKWNFKDELQAVAQQSVVAGSPETTWYVYDGGGQRVRKITDNQADAGVEPTRKAERIYVGGIEVYREFGLGAVDLERKTCQVMDDKSRVAMIETRTAGVDDSPPRLVRYQFGNHLGSACIETDATARIITYEEYHPFGTTSYQATDQDIKAAAKRYRYTAMERDEESGMEYHSARYYLPWLGRWLSPDPKGMVDGPNLYRYARNNPIRLNDPTGTDPPDDPPVRVTPLVTQVSPTQVSGSVQFNDLFSSDRSASGQLTLSGGVRSSFLLQVPRIDLRTTGLLDASGTAQVDTAAGTGRLDLRAGLVLGAPPSGLNLVTIGRGSFQIPIPGQIPLGQVPQTFLGALPQAEGDFRLHGAVRAGTFQLGEFQGQGTLSGGLFNARLTATTIGDIGRVTATASGTVGPGGAFSLSTFSADARVRVPVLLSLDAHAFGIRNASGGYDLSGSARTSIFGIPSIRVQGTGTASAQGVDFAGTFSGLGPLATSYIAGDFSLSTSRGISARAVVAGLTYTPSVSVTDPSPSPRGVGPVRPLAPWDPGGLTVGVSLFRYSQGNLDHISGGFMPDIGEHILTNPRFGITGVVHF